MQTKILGSLIGLIMSVAVFAQQGVNSTVVNNADGISKEPSFTLSVVPDKTSPSFGLYVYNPGQRTIRLLLISKTYGEVVDTSFSSAQFHRRYNFEQADDGRYFVKGISGKETITKTVDVSTVIVRNINVQ
jgi:hypothetical protein